MTTCLNVKDYIAGRFIESNRNLDVLKNPANRKILRALKIAYPKGHTANELKSITNLPPASVYSSLEELKQEGYVIDVAAKKGTGVKPSNEYVIEDSSSILQSLFHYQISPGNVKFSDDFKNAWEVLVPREDESNLLHELTQFIQKIVRLTRESDQEAIKKIAPDLRKEFCCRNCGLNHEARDFIRAILIHLIDRLEVQREFVEFQNNNQLLRDTAFEKIIKLSEQFEREDKRRVAAKPIPKSSPPKEEQLANEPIAGTHTLRILSIQKDTFKEQVSFTATDKKGILFDGTIDRAILRDEINPNTIVECTTKTPLDEIEYYHSIDISIDDSIEVKRDDPSFPKVSQLETKIEDIDTTKREYVLNGVILREPQMSEQKTDQGTSKITWTLLGDETGYIEVQEQNANFLDKFHKNDKVRVIDAVSYENLLVLSPHGSIEKIDTVDEYQSARLLQGHQITPPNKISIVEQEKTRGGIKVVLHKVHLLSDYTRLFVTIENTNENSAISLITIDLVAIQGKNNLGISTR